MADGLKGTVKSADRVLTLFELLGRWGREMSHAEITEVLGIPKSSLSQILKNLVARGWLSYSSDSKGYSLGDAILSLAQRTSRVRNIAEIAEPTLKRLTEDVQESSALNLLKGDFEEVVATQIGPRRLLTQMQLGDSAPLHVTSGGKAMLAFLPRDMLDEYLSRATLVRFTSSTITSKRKLIESLETIRRERLAYSLEEYVVGVVGMARPVLDGDERVIASINVAVPAIRFNRNASVKIALALNVAVGRISQQLLAGETAASPSRQARKRAV